MNKHGCQCEHACHMHGDRASAHFGGLEENAPRKLSPNGNPSHRYGTEFFDGAMSRVRTEYGTFIVCNDCAEDCHGGCQADRLCACGSGKAREELEDARGIFVAYVCEACVAKVKAKYRPEIFENPQYDTYGEAVDED